VCRLRREWALPGSGRLAQFQEAAGKEFRIPAGKVGERKRRSDARNPLAVEGEMSKARSL